MESAVELAMETSRAEELKCEANQLDYVLRSLLKKKKIQVISTADESVSSRKDISTSQESAGSLHSRRKKKRRRRGDLVVSYSAISRCYLKIAIAKRCRLHKLIRQRFALAIKIQQEDFVLLFQQMKLQKIQSQCKVFQTQCF
ncbi:hypothetical protein F511_07839 [Dorcoceras hygrometricum]|uniref:Uncharacterized protein n=1 Tax=Dorcoceras hygrometricum TaxID=472368 RepID=A0A2Z7B0B5_9LAMI|nr:hypothetical protein F511_07839 [Dorcoceras hygrometricum]